MGSIDPDPEATAAMNAAAGLPLFTGRRHTKPGTTDQCNYDAALYRGAWSCDRCGYAATADGERTMRRLTDREIAIICHYNAQGYQDVLGQPAPAPSWHTFPEERRAMVERQVARAKRGYSPRELFESWRAEMVELGWVWGPVKDPDAKPPTHPNLVDWDQLPLWEQNKDSAFQQAVLNYALMWVPGTAEAAA
jgi:hypothetical protein